MSPEPKKWLKNISLYMLVVVDVVVVFVVVVWTQGKCKVYGNSFVNIFTTLEV